MPHEGTGSHRRVAPEGCDRRDDVAFPSRERTDPEPPGMET
jgi:hypothetical protein